MSCYEWEHGAITLPAGYAPKLRKELNDAVLTQIKKIVSETSAAWEVIKKVPASKRKMALYSMYEKMSEDAYMLMIQHKIVDGEWTEKITKPGLAAIKDSLVRNVAPYNSPNGKKNTVFRVGNDATILFDGNNITWDVPENNHATEHARAHPLAHVFFEFLNRVEWTSRSGGTIVGNDEYNSDDYSESGGGNYVVREYSRKKQLADRASRTAYRYGGRW